MKLLWIRLNIIVAWPLLVIIDAGLALCGIETWQQARGTSNRICARRWRKE